MDVTPLQHAGGMLSLALVFWTGSALFAALHPGAMRRLTRGRGVRPEPGPEREDELPSLLRLRVLAALMGAAGLLLLLLPWPG